MLIESGIVKIKLISACRTDKRKSYAGIAARRLNNYSIGFYQSLIFGVLYH